MFCAKRWLLLKCFNKPNASKGMDTEYIQHRQWQYFGSIFPQTSTTLTLPLPQALTINTDSNIVFDAAVTAQHFATDGESIYCIDTNYS